jgi:cation diffusion facilitator family transporter
MEIRAVKRWEHDHAFNHDPGAGERNTRLVIYLTLVMMVVEVSAGSAFGSMALLADGWHMGTHAAALGITAMAYFYARKHAANPRYSFGTGKVGILGGFSSAVVLAMIALLMGVEAFQRLMSPRPIRFGEAIAVAIIGLIVNLVSAWLLWDRHSHADGHGHATHRDHNLRAAYLHVLADAMTSVLAIVALLTGKFFGWLWMDALMGIVGSAIIMKWSYGLLMDTGKILLDRDVDLETVEKVRSLVEADSLHRVTDIHVWRVGPHHLSVILSILTTDPQPPGYYKKLLAKLDDIVHVTIEVNHWPGGALESAGGGSVQRSH